LEKVLVRENNTDRSLLARMPANGPQKALFLAYFGLTYFGLTRFWRTYFGAVYLRLTGFPAKVHWSSIARRSIAWPSIATSKLPQRALSLVIVLAMAFTLLTPVQAGSRKAKKLYNEGRQAEFVKDLDKALSFYEQALNEHPGHQGYLLSVRRMTFVAAQAHVSVGRRLRNNGNIEEALAQFQRAVEMDPASTVAAQESSRTIEILEDREKRKEKGETDSDELEGASPLERARAARQKKVGRLKDLQELKPISSEPINLNIPKQTSKVVFETIGKLAGINVLFDSEFDDEEVTFEIQNATLYEALDYVGLIAKAYWKPLTSNAIFVTNDNTNKRRDYQEEVVKTFYLTNAATPQELQEVATAIRGLTDIRRLFAVNSMNALIVRGSADKIALAEKVINDIDKARPEVIIDVLVLETSKSRNRDLGITPVAGGGPGLSFPVSFTGAGIGAGGEGGGGVALNNLGKLGSRDWSTTLPGAQLTALLSSSDTRLLQSPRIRAADNFQASLRIGDRIPIATGSFQPGIGGVGINPLVNTQFTYTDVGVVLDLTPKIHSNSEVSMHVEVEISTVRDFVDIGGISQPVIGQRRVVHDIRIKEGQASIMGGLFQSQLFKTKSGVPFLGEIPILGRLFSSTNTTLSENEILVVLIPHIVRLPDIREINLQEVASGTEQTYRVRYEPQKNDKPALPPVGVNGTQPATETAAGAAPAAAAPLAPAAAVAAPGVVPAQVAPPATGAAAAPVPATPSPAAPAPVAPAAAGAGAAGCA
jgi:general secretion pathway protein D